MNKRLASFKGPSSPSSSPAQRRQPQNQPSPPSRATETTYHRQLRTYLQELRAIAKTWNDLILIDGLKAATTLVDTRTELDNALSLIPDRQPRSTVVIPKLAVMEQRIVELDAVISKLHVQFRKMNTVVEKIEALLLEACRLKGWEWVSTVTLWLTWPLEKFVSSISGILIPYHRSLHAHKELVGTFRSHSLSFEDSRKAIAAWIAQDEISEYGWFAEWEDLCAVEVERWDKVG